MSSMKRKKKLATIETKFENIDQPEIGVSGSSLAVRYNIGIVIRLSEPPPVPTS